ncbi:hypothetical protein [Gynuella sunshinyii]|uniref:Uncharacterized protein n=1 Tax=Gynuella sunshinyii YC6258 TaxID=1445510 RepID=A0A0C5VD57_9GAMM|nr:hypothetical protein [Gynuella sunshinyii]AJQ92472.1 hypothetical Protein YC6258_00422 [Gynuella sunshinyii YC6258]
MFHRYLREKIAPLQLEQRRIIELSNPIIPDMLPTAESGLWYQIPGKR